MGSKNRHAKDILPIILKNRKTNQWYVEPFCGGCNMIDKVGGLRIANDYHFYLIEMWKAIQNGWIPPDFISEDEYKNAKSSQGIEPYLKGFIGFGCSFSGKWFGGYARGKASDGKERNYCMESKKNIINQSIGITGIKFYNGHYMDFPIPDNSIIYCDPPYRDTTKYKQSEGDFDHDTFWDWVRFMEEEGHEVYISEYNAPDDFECLWSKEVNSSLTKETGSKKAIEKLFRLKNRA